MPLALVGCFEESTNCASGYFGLLKILINRTDQM